MFISWHLMGSSSVISLRLMVHSHYVGLGLRKGPGSGTGLGSMDSNISYRNVHTSPRQRKGPGPIVSYCASSIPCTAPFPVRFSVNNPYLPPATKLGQGYVFTRVCDSVHRGGGIPACIAGGIPACLAAGFQVGGIPACLAGLQAHTQGVSSGPHPGGSPGTHWGVSQHALRLTPPQLLLRAVHILLECILVAM